MTRKDPADSRQHHHMIAKTLAGLEDLLAREVKAQGGQDIRIEKRAVRFKGNQEVLYRMNYFSRTALRILLIISEFQVASEEELYDHVHHIDWRKQMTIKQSLMVDSVVYSDVFRHSHYVALKVKDAIADHFRKHTSLRPSVNTRQPDIRVHIHIANRRATLALDSSGESLHKRGYRQAHGVASLNEVLAAGMILLSGWDGKSLFMDPMCGSGTLLIEAALMALGIPPGHFRNRFMFQNWMNHDPELFNKIKSSARIQTGYAPEIFGSDLSGDQLKICKKNIQRAGLADIVTLKKLSFSDIRPEQTSGTIIINPPYGERFRDADLETLYREMGSHLKRYFAGFSAWILSSNLKALKHVGLHPRFKFDLYNGELKCKFQGYDLYQGSRKSKTSTENEI